MCGLFWGAHKSLAPRARTLLGGLGQATLSFFAVATLLFVFFGECPIFCDLAKQRRKIVGGVSEVGKDDFSLYFCWRCVFFSYFYFSSAAIARHQGSDFFLLGPVLSLWRACPGVGCAPRGRWEAVPGEMTFHRCEGRLVLVAFPLPVVRPWGRAARTRCPCVPGAGCAGLGHPALAPQRKLWRASVAHCGGGVRATRGGVPRAVLRGV